MAQTQSASFYSEIMGDISGSGCGVTISTSNSTKVSDTTAYFASKRFGTKEQIQSCDSDVFHFDGVGHRNRGIRPWEKARNEAFLRRKREQEFHKQRRPVSQNPATEHKTLSFREELQASKVMKKPVQSKPDVHSKDEFEDKYEIMRQSIVVDAWDD
jgi:hypothetical protein